MHLYISFCCHWLFQEGNRTDSHFHNLCMVSSAKPIIYIIDDSFPLCFWLVWGLCFLNVFFPDKHNWIFHIFIITLVFLRCVAIVKRLPYFNYYCCIFISPGLHVTFTFHTAPTHLNILIYYNENCMYTDILQYLNWVSPILINISSISQTIPKTNLKETFS